VNKELGSDHYNKVYKSGGNKQVYFLDADQVPVYSRLWSIVAEEVRDCQEVVDLGCGPGHFPQMMRQKGIAVPYRGYDFSDVALDQARQKNLEDCEFHQANLYEIGNIEASTFVCLEVLEHIEKDIELLESTVPTGATLFFSVPNYTSSGHVRVFKDTQEVADRYSGLFELSHRETITFGGQHKIFIFSGVRR
jgi:trans-aconitate methyltransferase